LNLANQKLNDILVTVEKQAKIERDIGDWQSKKILRQQHEKQSDR
jgi:hypothetical protein